MLATLLTRLDNIETRLNEKHYFMTTATNGSLSTQEAESHVANVTEPPQIDQADH